MIFYFTATGNSLYVAKQMDDNRISIAQAIHDQKKIYTADKIGIVCPIFGHEMPELVKEFLKVSRFKTDYFYILLTYGNLLKRKFIFPRSQRMTGTCTGHFWLILSRWAPARVMIFVRLQKNALAVESVQRSVPKNVFIWRGKKVFGIVMAVSAVWPASIPARWWRSAWSCRRKTLMPDTETRMSAFARL